MTDISTFDRIGALGLLFASISAYFTYKAYTQSIENKNGLEDIQLIQVGGNLRNSGVLGNAGRDINNVNTNLLGKEYVLSKDEENVLEALCKGSKEDPNSMGYIEHSKLPRESYASINNLIEMGYIRLISEGVCQITASGIQHIRNKRIDSRKEDPINFDLVIG